MLRTKNLLGLCAVGLAAACTQDYGKFDTSGAPDASTSGGTGATSGGTGATAGVGASGGSAGAAATGGSAGAGAVGGNAGTGATGGSAGSGGSAGGSCGANQKQCGANCVSDSDPQTGCATTSCSPCPSQNATPSCQSGQCALSCTPGFLDCNTDVKDGCEHSTSSPTTASCGGCGNNCASQGFGGGFSCSGGMCRCTSGAQCKASGGPGAATCNAGGSCVCDGKTCQPGEACVKQGPSLQCTCNSGTACAVGTTCCVSPAGCKNLSNDNANCGGCGVACATGQNCVSGSCQ